MGVDAAGDVDTGEEEEGVAVDDEGAGAGEDLDSVFAELDLDLPVDLPEAAVCCELSPAAPLLCAVRAPSDATAAAALGAVAVAEAMNVTLGAGCCWGEVVGVLDAMS